MGFRIVPMYTYDCDWEGCEANNDDGSEYCAWLQKEGAEATRDYGDVLLRIGDEWFCEEHMHWDEEHERYLPGPEVFTAYALDEVKKFGERNGE